MLTFQVPGADGVRGGLKKLAASERSPGPAWQTVSRRRPGMPSSRRHRSRRSFRADSVIYVAARHCTATVTATATGTDRDADSDTDATGPARAYAA